MFHATTRLTAAELERAVRTAAHQEDRVLLLFRRYGSLSPSVALRHYVAQGWPEPPLTSIRRAITDLAAAGALTKTELQVRGPYSALETVWRLADAQPLAA